MFCIVEGTPLVRQQDVRLKELSIEIDQVCSYMKMVLHNRGKHSSKLASATLLM